jgi:hypothetical protein
MDERAFRPSPDMAAVAGVLRGFLGALGDFVAERVVPRRRRPSSPPAVFPSA